MESFGLIATNTHFQKPAGKLWTCQYPNGSRAQLDYIIVRRKWVNSVTDAQSYKTTFDTISSDHKAITATIKLSLRAPKKKQSDFRAINFRSLTSSKELQNLYSVEVYNRFSSLVGELPATAPLQEKYDCLGKSCADIGKQLLPKKKAKKWSNLQNSPKVIQDRDNFKKALISGRTVAIMNAKRRLAQS